MGHSNLFDMFHSFYVLVESFWSFFHWNYFDCMEYDLNDVVRLSKPSNLSYNHDYYS